VEEVVDVRVIQMPDYSNWQQRAALGAAAHEASGFESPVGYQRMVVP